MPNNVAGSREILQFIARQISKDTYVNIMDQYYPDGIMVQKPDKYDRINRSINRDELFDVFKIARDEGLYRVDERWRWM